jgi:hypothetical protein
MTGDLTQGPSSLSRKFIRTGDAKVEGLKSSPAMAREFLGTWEGALEGPGLRLVLNAV